MPKSSFRTSSSSARHHSGSGAVSGGGILRSSSRRGQYLPPRPIDTKPQYHPSLPNYAVAPPLSPDQTIVKAERGGVDDKYQSFHRSTIDGKGGRTAGGGDDDERRNSAASLSFLETSGECDESTFETDGDGEKYLTPETTPASGDYETDGTYAHGSGLGRKGQDTFETMDSGIGYSKTESISQARSGMTSFDYTIGAPSDDNTVARRDAAIRSLLNDGNDSDYYYVKQKYGFLSIGLSVIQLLVLMLMLALCGVAPLDVNPMVGPYPDALSSWGGKNVYRMLEGKEVWRLVSPAGLHVGVVHLLCNVAVQLETGAFFEREWGSKLWLIVYLASAVGSMLLSSILLPDDVCVGSSGAVMGLYGAKLSEVMCLAFFDTMGKDIDLLGDTMRIEQLAGVLCSGAVVCLFSLIPYVDWAGHLGGLGAGFVVGMTIFAKRIRSTAWKILWGGLGIILVSLGFGYGLYYLFGKGEVQPDEELADACEYFRRLFVEGYDCACST